MIKNLITEICKRPEEQEAANKLVALAGMVSDTPSGAYVFEKASQKIIQKIIPDDNERENIKKLRVLIWNDLKNNLGATETYRNYAEMFDLKLSAEEIQELDLDGILAISLPALDKTGLTLLGEKDGRAKIVGSPEDIAWAEKRREEASSEFEKVLRVALESKDWILVEVLARAYNETDANLWINLNTNSFLGLTEYHINWFAARRGLSAGEIKRRLLYYKEGYFSVEQLFTN